jgi:HEAT repeat protein
VFGDWYLSTLGRSAGGYFDHLRDTIDNPTESEIKRVNALSAISTLFPKDSRLADVYHDGLVADSPAMRTETLKQIFSLGEPGVQFIGGVLPMLYDRVPEVRSAAARTLGGLAVQSPEIQHELQNALLQHETDSEFQKLALWALGAVGNRSALPGVSKIAVTVEDPQVQLSAHRAAERITTRHPGGLKELWKNTVYYLAGLHPRLAPLAEYL